jgi:hypothetical protein
MKKQTKKQVKIVWEEEEVLSIPAGRTYEAVKKFGVYICPDTETYNFKKSWFVTFREPIGGGMEILYKWPRIYSNIGCDVESVKKATIPQEDKERIIAYLEGEVEAVNNFDVNSARWLKRTIVERKNMKFLVFDTSHVIAFPPNALAYPQKIRFTGRAYYYLCDVLDERKRKALKPSSQYRN